VEEETHRGFCDNHGRGWAHRVPAPKEHSRLWVVGPKSTRRIGLWFVEEPERMRVLGAAQVVLGVWLALRQHRDI
jgi:hypothetical protein